MHLKPIVNRCEIRTTGLLNCAHKLLSWFQTLSIQLLSEESTFFFQYADYFIGGTMCDRRIRKINCVQEPHKIACNVDIFITVKSDDLSGSSLHHAKLMNIFFYCYRENCELFVPLCAQVHSFSIDHKNAFTLQIVFIVGCFLPILYDFTVW